MGMKKGGAKRQPIIKRALPTSSAVNKINESNGSAGEVMLTATGGVRNLEYACVNIPLSDIETNPDNEIFRQADTEEDIERLAEDIDRNGLMHNLVVYEKQEDGKTKFVLLSGERRYLAIKLLAAKGNANWNTVRDCHVVTSKLSDNEKKVLLYSANLQVRGGFGDEQIRRKAGAEFIECLQKEPYNLSKEDATKALKEISAVTAKQIDRDINIEEKLNGDLLKLLDEHFVTRPQSETFLKFDAQQQEKIAEQLIALCKVDCTSKDSGAQVRQERKRDRVQGDLIKDIESAQKEKDPDERNRKLEEAFEDCQNAIEELKALIVEEKAAAAAGDSKKLDELDKADALSREEKRVAEKTSADEKESFVVKSLPSVVAKMDKKMNSASYKKGIKRRTAESREKDIEILNQLIEKAQSLKAMIEAAE